MAWTSATYFDTALALALPTLTAHPHSSWTLVVQAFGDVMHLFAAARSATSAPINSAHVGAPLDDDAAVDALELDPAVDVALAVEATLEEAEVDPPCPASGEGPSSQPYVQPPAAAAAKAIAIDGTRDMSSTVPARGARFNVAAW